MALATGKKLIYIIDDDLTILKIIGLRLEALGYEYRTFEHPEDFLSAVKARRPDLCLIDLHIGSASRKVGMLLLQALRKTYGEKLPLIVISADSDNSSIADAISHGADSYLSKPIRRDTFEELLDDFLDVDKIQHDHLHQVPDEKRVTQMSFELSPTVIDQEGVCFESPALIVKGTHLSLGGELKKWLNAREPVKVQVVQNWLIPDSNCFGHYAVFEEPSEEVSQSILRALAAKNE